MPRRLPSFRPAGLLLAALIASLAAHAAPASTTTFEEVLIMLPTRDDALRVLKEIPDIEWLKPVDEEGTYRAVSTPEIDERIRAMGYRVTVAVPDLEARAASLQLGPGFGAFHTLSEAEAVLDSLHAAFPAISTAKFSIGTTIEGRAIWAIKVSDNPDVDENEPEVLFDGCTHAREVMTVEMCLHYLDYLLSSYGTDPLATFLVDHREVWFVPVINADGYVYNETTNPNGGGLWRKNRRNNGDGTFGVDLNRNYSYQWGGQGASTVTSSETYRGTAPNSEPEVQAMEAFIDAHEFVTHQSFHSYAELILLPWGYDHLVQSPDDSLLRAVGNQMAIESGYEVGQPGEVLYNASGNAFDWSYGETTNHTKIVSYTTEIGGTDFWPAESEAPGLLAENLSSNLYLTKVAGPFLEVAVATVTSESGGPVNGRLDPGETDGVTLTVKNLGVAGNLAAGTATLSTADPYVTLAVAQVALGAFASGETRALAAPFSFAVDLSCPPGHEIAFTVSFASDGVYSSIDAFSLSVGPYYTQDFEAASDWTQDPSHTAATGAWVRIDPNPTTYQPGDDAPTDPGSFALITAQNSAASTDDVDNGIAATRSPEIDLSGAPRARLDLYWNHGQRDLADDAAGDFFRIDLSTDGGATYPTTLASVGDVTRAPTWTALSVRLDSLVVLSEKMRIRARASDAGPNTDTIEGGLDAIQIIDPGSDNAAPNAPIALSPTGGVTVGSTPTLTVSNATDPEASVLVYGFRVYADSLLTSVAASVDSVPEGSLSTAWALASPLGDGPYWFRAYASDGEVRGLFSGAATFTVASGTGIGPDVTASASGAAALVSLGPNPSRGATRFAYDLPRAGRVFVAVVNLEGRVVRVIENSWREAGRHDALWDGRDAAGREAASGAYLLRLEAGSDRRTERVTLIR